jgi:hypothetical protein
MFIFTVPSMAGYIKYNHKPQNNAKVIGRQHEVPKRIYALKNHKKEFTFNYSENECFI